MSWFQQLVLAWRMMRRDLRAGELHLLGFALLIAVASLTSVSFLADRVGRALEREANQLLGGDLLLTGDRPWEQRFISAAADHGLELAQTVLLTSMLGSEQGMALAGVKAVDANYPLRGVVRIADGPNQLERVAAAMPAPGEVWLDERLFAELDLAVGDQVQLGVLELRVAALLSFEADRGGNIFSFLPRAIINRDDLAASGLIGEGSRASWRLHVAGSVAQVAAYEHWLGEQLGRGQRIETVANARPEVRAALDQAQRFLRLAAMLAVVLAAVAVGLCARRFLARHLDACAVMRTLGASQVQVLTVVIGEFLLFGLLVVALGSGSGALLQAVLAGSLAGLLGTELPAPSLLPLGHGVLVGLVLLIGFVLPQLLRLSRVSTLRVLRRELEVFEQRSVLAWLLGGLALIALLMWIAADLRLGLMVALAFAGALAVYLLAAWLLLTAVVRLSARLGPGLRVGWRQGLAALGRRRQASVLQIAALGIGMTTLLLLGLLRGDLLASWQAMAPPEAPNRFVINIQPEQRRALGEFFVAHDLPAPRIEPMIRGRLLAINDEAVKAENYADERTRRLVEREFNLSWASELPRGNEVVSGRWHGEGAGSAQFSVEQGLAQTFALKLGDRVAFEIAGERVEAPITSVRALDWDSMRVNFFFIAAPGMIEAYPTSLITSFHLPPDHSSFSAQLIVAFPNLTVIDVTAVLAQVQAMAGKLIFIVQAVFGFAVLAGLVVLLAALQASHDERRYEMALLRTLGARRVLLRKALLVELGTLGLLAGSLAVLGASLIAGVLARHLFELAYLPAWLPLLLTIVLATAAVLIAGWLGIRHLLFQSPLHSLRNQ